MATQESDDDDLIMELLKKGARHNVSKDYVRFDEIEDVLASSDLMALVSPFVKKKPSYWKWLIIGAHNALQGALVCALADTTKTSVLDKKSAAAMLDFLQKPVGNRGKPPREHMASFDVLLERCMTKRPDSEPLVLDSDSLKDIKQLHKEFRNNFAHFAPMGWSIEKKGLPRIMGAAINATEWLMSQDQVTYRMSGNRLRRLKANLEATRAALGIAKGNLKV